MVGYEVSYHYFKCLITKGCSFEAPEGNWVRPGWGFKFFKPIITSNNNDLMNYIEFRVI